MSNLLKSKFFLGALVVAVMFVGAVAVKATPAKADCSTGTTTLKVGSKGDAVKCLQAGVGATADGSFGPMTKAKVAAWQASVGLTADGVFGPMSRAKFTGGMTGTYPAGCMSSTGFSTTTGLPCSTTGSLPAGCTSTAGYSSTTGVKCDSTGTTTGPLAGTSGVISDVNQLSQYNAEEVGAGQKDVKVLGFEVEASNDGDIGLNSMKLVFDSTGNNSADSDRITDYVDAVTIWQGSTKVGSAKASEFTKDDTGIYSKVILLSGSVVKSDATEKFYVSVDAVSNLDSGDIDSDSWTIALDNIRFVDGGGVVTTETSAIDGNIDYVSAGDGVAIAFTSFSSASDTELKFSTNSTPEAGYVKVDASDDTDNVVVLKGKMKVDGTSDVWFDELPVTLVSTGDSIDALVGSITLKLGSEEFTESLGANCTGSCASNTTAVVTFDNLDMTLAAGSTTNFSVEVDINDLENSGVTATDFDAGDSLTVSVTSTNRGNVIAENEEGDQLADSTEMTGTVTGEAQTFYENGVNVVMGTTTYTTVTDSGNVTQVTYTIPMTVTSFGETLYTGLSAEYEADAGAVNDDLALAFELQDSTAPTTGLENGTVSSTFTSSDATIEGGTAFRLDEGETYHFTLQVIHTTPGTASRSYRVALNEFQTYTDAALNTSELIQTLTPTQNYQTGYQFITS